MLCATTKLIKTFQKDRTHKIIKMVAVLPLMSVISIVTSAAALSVNLMLVLLVAGLGYAPNNVRLLCVMPFTLVGLPIITIGKIARLLYNESFCV